MCVCVCESVCFLPHITLSVCNYSFTHESMRSSVYEYESKKSAWDGQHPTQLSAHALQSDAACSKWRRAS